MKVAIPHCRGKWFPITAIQFGSDALVFGRIGSLPNCRAKVSPSGVLSGDAIDTSSCLLPLYRSPASGYEVENQDHRRDYKQKVNQAAANVKAEAEKPENQHDYKYCPKHWNPLFIACLTGT